MSAGITGGLNRPEDDLQDPLPRRVHLSIHSMDTTSVMAHAYDPSTGGKQGCTLRSPLADTASSGPA